MSSPPRSPTDIVTRHGSEPAARWGALGALLLAALGCGSSLTASRKARMEASPQFRDGKFHNVVPMAEEEWLGILAAQFRASNYRSPEDAAEIPVESVAPTRFAEPPESGLRITWLGHSSVLVELDGYRILTDPVWSKRASPFSWIGPSRFHAPPLALEDLPDLDAVVLSHDHYDHLDEATIRRLDELAGRGGSGVRVRRWAVPLGVGQHLEQIGVPAHRIEERDWWQEVKLGSLRLTCAPARHFSGRSIVFADRDETLWAGWAMRGPRHAVYFTGDSGMFEGFSEIGDKLGPFDAALVETGAYNSLWSDVHMGPEQAVLAHRLLRARLYLPVHWGTFDLAMHGWTEPVERVLLAAQEQGVEVAVPRPGQSIDPSSPPALARWWPERPWQTASEAPVVSTHLPASLAERLDPAAAAAAPHTRAVAVAAE